ncbi:MAG: tetratricopeptide repeat protein [Kiritimatiellales bacterium]|nr:tetratricopeptide repeat protein [Kiritimatiellales bacterium]MCF7864603.1 tetratricopeptide repeat protein [Kiritimatiellales bacterium]
MAEVKLEDAPQGVRTFYDKGISAMARANLDYAMDMFEAVLHIEPRLLDVRRLLRTAAMQKYKTHLPGRLASVKRAGNLLKLAMGRKTDPFQTLETAEKLMRTDPFNLRNVKALREAAVAAGLPEAAIQTLEILRDHRPNDLAILEPLANLYRDAKQSQNEYDCRNRIARLKPNDAAALKELKDSAARNTMEKAGWGKAESYRDVAKPQESEAKGDIESCMEKIRREPDNLNYRRTLADLHLHANQFDKAIQTLEACLEKTGGSDPQLERALAEARNLKTTHEIAQAEEAGDTAYATKLRKKRDAVRIDEAARRVQRYPNDLQLRFEYGQLLFESERYTEAIQQFQQAQRNPQRRVQALFHMAMSFKQKGQFDIALQQLETACGELAVMDSGKKEMLYELAALCETMGETDRAVRFFKEIYAVDIGYRDVAVKVEQTYGS